MSRTVLNKLLSHSFANYQLLFNGLALHNHNAHHLGSLHLLGATDEQLEKTYETMCKYLDSYEKSPEEITVSNWRKHLGNKHFCQSYRDFFHQQLTSNGSNWHKKFLEFLLDTPEQPMINGVIGGLAHPLIHIGYAFELDHELVASEALGMTAVCYNYLHEVVDRLQPPTSPSKIALEIFKDIRADDQLPTFDKPDASYEAIVKNKSTQIFSHYNQWKINKDDLPKSIEELFDFTVYVFGATHKSDQILFDFFLLHLLTSMHAIRTMYPHFNNPELFQRVLLQFFYFAIVVYVAQLRPEINEKLIDDYPIENEKTNWKYIIDRTLNTKLIDDAHAVKVVRALRDAEEVYGKKNGLYMKTAVKMIENLNVDDLWVGGSEDKRQLNVLKQA